MQHTVRISPTEITFASAPLRVAGMIVYARTRLEYRTAVFWQLAKILLGITSGMLLFRSLSATDFGAGANAVLLLLAGLSLLDVFMQVRVFTADVLLGGLRTRVCLTATALAIKTPGYPAVYVRKRACIGLKPATFTYITATGREISVLEHETGRWGLLRRAELVRLAFEAWWPEVNQEARLHYLKQYETTVSRIEKACFLLLFLASVALTMLFVVRTSYLSAVMIYPLLSQGFLLLHRILHRKRIQAVEQIAIPTPDGWLDHLHEQRIARLEALGLRDPEGRAARPEPVLFTWRTTRLFRKRLAQFTIVAGVLSFTLAATTIYQSNRYPDGWIATNWRPFNLVFSFSSMIAVCGVFQFVSGRIYACVIANSKTIAVRRGRSPFVWLKRRDCVACGKDGLSLILSDGSEHRLLDENSISTLDPREFLARLYETWWPGTTLESIVRHQVRAPQPWYWYLIKWSAILLPLLAVANVLVLLGARPVALLSISALMLIPTFMLASAMHFGRSGRFLCPLPPPDAEPADIPEGVYAED